MNKIELISFLKANVNGKGDLDRDVVIVTSKKQCYKIFNLRPYNKSKTKIGYYDEGFKIYKSIQPIDDLGEFIDMLDSKYNILYFMTIKDKKHYYYENVTLDNVMTLPEATEKWGLADSTLRKLIATDKLINGVDYKKSGNSTLITRRAMIKIYGDIPIEIRVFDFYKEYFKKELEKSNNEPTANFLRGIFNKTLVEHYFNKYDIDSLEKHPEIFELDFCKITLNEEKRYLKIEKDNKCIEYTDSSYKKLYNEFKSDLFIKYCNCDFVEYIVLKTYYEF